MLYNAIGLSVDKFVENLSMRRQVNIPETSVDVPNQIASQLLNEKFKDDRSVLNSVKTRYATEFAYHRETRNLIVQLVKEFITISTEPTTLGEEKINAFHKYAPIKRIRNKKLRIFEEYSAENGKMNDNILFILNAVEEKYITMKLDISNEFIPSITSKLELENESIEWKEFKKDIIVFAMKYYLRDYIEREIIAELRRNTANKIIAEMQYNLEKRINQKKHYKLRRNGMDPNEFSVGGISFTRTHILLAKSNAATGEFKTSQLIDVRRMDTQKLRENIDEFFGGDETSVIGIEANTKRSLFVSGICKNLKYDCHFMNRDLGRMYRFEADPDINSQLSFSASSVCRQLINPIAEFVHIVTTKERLMAINLHKAQGYLQMKERDLAFEKIEQTLISIINQRGVNLYQAMEYPHCANQLNYINGLGKLRTQWLFENRNQNESQDMLTSREEFVGVLSGTLSKKIISDNCHGFLTLPVNSQNDLKMLDETRILLEHYNLAETLVKSAVNDEKQHRGRKKEPTFKEKLMTIRSNENNLFNELDIDQFIEDNQNETEGFRQIVMDIQKELLEPFKMEMNNFDEITKEEIFEGVTNASPSDFQRNQLIEFTVTRNRSETGYGQINPDLTVEFKGLSNKVENGSAVYGRVTDVKIDKCIVVVDCNDRIIYDTKRMTEELYRLTRYVEPYLFVDEKDKHLGELEQENDIERDYSKIITNVREFKLISASKAKEELKQGKNGDYILVPIPEDGLFKGALMLVWKWTNDVILNLECVEEGNSSSMRITIKRFNKTFDTIMTFQRYVNKVNEYLDDLRNHRKYNADDDRVDTDLLKLKAMHPNMLNYTVSISKSKLGCIRLAWIPGTKTVSNQFVRVDENGFNWNNKSFVTTEDLVSEFKNEMMKALGYH